MPTKITQLKVLLSSPNDLRGERDAFEEIVGEANRYLEKVIEMTLTPIKWETHTYPSVGKDAQEVINIQLPEYDIYVGIVGDRIGTQTPRGESGTIEEFQNVFQKNSINTSDKRILFYFKDVKKSISEIDPVEVKAINTFREKLGKEGVYYWKYLSIHDFRRLLCFHLYCHAIEYYKMMNYSINVDSLEFIRNFIEEGTRYVNLTTDCFKLISDTMMKGKVDIDKVGMSLRNASKSKNLNLMNLTVKTFIGKVKSINERVKFYFEIYSVLYGLALDNYTKGILGFSLAGVLQDIIDVMTFAKDKQNELLSVMSVFKKDTENLITFDTMFKTNIYHETISLFDYYCEIISQSINMTEEFIKVCVRVK